MPGWCVIWRGKRADRADSGGSQDDHRHRTAARIGELLRLRGLIMAAHEEQLERIDGRLRALYPAAFLAMVATTQGQGNEPPDFLSWYAGQPVRV